MEGVRAKEERTTATAVILAGGRGTRLRPYTVAFPKPLVPVGENPILEIIIAQLARDGFRRVLITVGHMAGLIEAYFGDGSRWGVTIEYAHEGAPLGTAGPLRSLQLRLPPEFLVLNGDILTDLNFASFLQAHISDGRRPLVSISSYVRSLNSEFGVIDADFKGRVTGYREKPSVQFCVSEGVYAFSRTALDWIPPSQRLDFPDLIIALLAAKQPVVTRPHEGLWLDIGRPDDYERAQTLISQHPDRLVPEGIRHRSGVMLVTAPGESANMRSR
jgi:mannose-1-phosphate guanylyltransferase